jgi:hypothetical protein
MTSLAVSIGEPSGPRKVHPDDRQLAGVLELVGDRLLLDLAAPVHRLHRAQHAATLGDALELGVQR